MTAPTPDQMRELADDLHTIDGRVHNLTLARARAALRAAADQLEAVQAQRDQWADRVAQVERVADMAEDDEDGNGWVPIEPLLDALYPEKRGVRND